MTEVVHARNLSKSYGSFQAMRGISFRVEKGSITGLIGPNGAGKSTTLKAMLGLTDFEGELQVLGMDPRSGRQSIMERVCFIADVGVLPRWLKVSEAVEYVEGIHPRFNREKAELLLSETKILPHQKVKELSKGMVTQLHLSLVLAIDVELLVLDEPTLGLDILYQKAFFDRLLKDFYDQETSIIISTHQVEEVKSLLTHVVLIDQGKIVLDRSMEQLSEEYVEVLVQPGKEEAALRMKPLDVRDVMGRSRMLFENVQRDELAALGPLHIPSISDIFVAKMKRV
jgi:ABC-2 type transport system ATP-binding protein